MSRRPKKRTKQYSGEDAKRSGTSSSSETIVHRFEAVDRSPLGEWWQTRKKLVRIVSIASAGVLGVGWLLVELFRTIF